MVTVRERMKSSAFMTWGGDRGEARPLNLELPFAAIGDSGVVVRLEFNWIDDLGLAMADLDAGPPHLEQHRRGPLRLAGLAAGFDAHGLVPVLEQTTFREKFALVDEAGEERFQLNIDHVVAQSLDTGRQGVFVDIDIAPTGAVDVSTLARLECLSAALMQRYGLRPVLATKAWRGAQATAYRA